MASALQFVNEEQTRETRLFIRMIDKFFDALNVKNPVESQYKRKVNRAPFKSPKDERFKVSVWSWCQHVVPQWCLLYNI